MDRSILERILMRFLKQPAIAGYTIGASKAMFMFVQVSDRRAASCEIAIEQAESTVCSEKIFSSQWIWL